MAFSRSAYLRATPNSTIAQKPQSILLPKTRPQPHVQARLAIANWLWGLFVTSLLGFVGAVLLVSLTNTAPVPRLPQQSQQVSFN